MTSARGSKWQGLLQRTKAISKAQVVDSDGEDASGESLLIGQNVHKAASLAHAPSKCAAWIYLCKYAKGSFLDSHFLYM